MDYSERARRNDESRNHAESHLQPWCADELEVLALWDRTDEALDILAEMLGRTREACRQRYYIGLSTGFAPNRERTPVNRSRIITTTTTTTVHAVHWADDDEWPAWYVRG